MNVRKFMIFANRLIVCSSLLAVASCSSVPGCRTAYAPAVQVESELVHRIATELQREHAVGTFDGLVLLVQSDTTWFKQAYGCADRDEGLANIPEVISEMGSIAKTFTAAAVLQFVVNGRLQLTDTIGDFYPDATEEIRRITIEQLLTHSSGLDNFHNDSDFESMDRSEAERRILAMPLVFNPGEQVAYSNAAYTLLAAVVERTSGRTFQQHVHENLLGPLGLKRTGFYQDAHIAVSALARGYGADDPGETTFEKGLTWALVGAGGMVASIDDLAVWLKALKDGSIFPDEASNPVFTEANDRWLRGSFAQININGEPIIQMGGSTDYGYTALIQFVPGRDLMIVLLLNAHDSKYGNATHHRLSRDHILPLVLSGKNGDKLPDRSMQPIADSPAD